MVCDFSTDVALVPTILFGTQQMLNNSLFI